MSILLISAYIAIILAYVLWLLQDAHSHGNHRRMRLRESASLAS